MPANGQTDSAKAVAKALAAIDGIGSRSTTLPPRLAQAVDQVLDAKGSASNKAALLFLVAYKVVDPAWSLRRVPTGWRPCDKHLCAGLTERGLTLHANIVAYGENMGIKGAADRYDLFDRPKLGDALKAIEGAAGSAAQVLSYVAARFKQSYRAMPKAQDLDDAALTFTRSLKVAHAVLAEETNGHFPQLLVAALRHVMAARDGTGRTIRTHHPNASDSSDKVAGDVEELDPSGKVVEAFEVTVRPDWKNRKPDLKKKLQAFGLDRYHVLCVKDGDPQLDDPEELYDYMLPLGIDVSVVDLRAFVEVCLMELSRDQRRLVFEKLFEYVRDPDLCAVPDYVDTLHGLLSGVAK